MQTATESGICSGNDVWARQGRGHEEARAVAAQQRFEWLRDAVRDEVHRCDTAALGRCLRDARGRTADKERALVILGLLGSAGAAAILEWYDARGEHWRVQLLQRLARRECNRRRACGLPSVTHNGAPSSAHEYVIHTVPRAM